MARRSDAIDWVSTNGCQFDWVKTMGLQEKSSQPLAPSRLAYSYMVGPACQSSSSWSLAKRGRNSPPPLAMAAKTKRYSHCCIELLLASPCCLHFQSPRKVPFHNGNQREIFLQDLL